MSKQYNEKKYEDNILKQGSNGQKIDGEIIVLIKLYLENNDVNKAKNVLNNSKQYIKKKTYNRWKKQIELFENNNKKNNNKLLPKTINCLIYIFLAALFCTVTFLIDYYLYDINKAVRTICMLINLFIHWKANSILKWYFNNRYGYRFSLDSFAGIGIGFWVLNFLGSIFLIIE